MRVINLHLENFQQFKDKKVSFGDGHMSFAGRNETGKTTLANAYMWLLTGKAYTNEPNYSPQTTKNDKLVGMNRSRFSGIETASGNPKTIQKILDALGYEEVVMKGRSSEQWDEFLEIEEKFKKAVEKSKEKNVPPGTHR